MLTRDFNKICKQLRGRMLLGAQFKLTWRCRSVLDFWFSLKIHPCCIPSWSVRCLSVLKHHRWVLLHSQSLIYFEKICNFHWVQKFFQTKTQLNCVVVVLVWLGLLGLCLTVSCHNKMASSGERIIVIRCWMNLLDDESKKLVHYKSSCRWSLYIAGTILGDKSTLLFKSWCFNWKFLNNLTNPAKMKRVESFCGIVGM